SSAVLLDNQNTVAPSAAVWLERAAGSHCAGTAAAIPAGSAVAVGSVTPDARRTPSSEYAGATTTGPCDTCGHNHARFTVCRTQRNVRGAFNGAAGRGNDERWRNRDSSHAEPPSARHPADGHTVVDDASRCGTCSTACR